MAEQVFHVGVKGLLRNVQGKLLLVRETFSGTQYYDIPGGRIDEDEKDPLETLVREMREEVGIEAFEVVGPPIVARSPKKIPIPGGEIALMLIAYPIRTVDSKEPFAQEPHLTIEWKAPAEAGELLRDKYPAAFCDDIKEL